METSQWVTNSLEPPSGHLNIANENAIRILGDLYADVIDLMGDSGYFHFGGDEVIVGSDETWAACYNRFVFTRNYCSLYEVSQ